MILDFFKTTELSAIGRQLLDSNKEVVDTALNTSQDIVKKGIDYNRSVLRSSVDALTSTRKETGRLVDEVLAQSAKVEERALETIDDVNDKAVERVEEFYDRIGNPSSTLGDAVKENFLDSLEEINKPSIKLLKDVSEQLTEVPRKLIKTAARSDEKSVKKAS